MTDIVYYSPEGLKQCGVQAIESFNIIETSKELDTIFSRYDFLYTTLAERLIPFMHQPEYLPSMQQAINKVVNRGQPLTMMHRDLIVNPHTFPVKPLLLRNITRAFDKKKDEYNADLNTNKSDKAQHTRILKFKKLAYYMSDELEKRIPDIEDMIEVRKNIILIKQYFDQYK